MSDKLGTVEASENLIQHLYIELRRKANYWATITKQTAQARMGYVGQHLVSVATGCPGARTGARGEDLVISADEYAEIKTCYRVDQLGSCKNCGSVVASIETKCPACGSTEIERKEDSKWLIGIRNEDEFARIIEPKWYYLALFDFVDINDPSEIRASIWRVDPKDIGFAYCMMDYYFNIRAKSTSKAPFNLWPYQLKFYLMKPELIYRSLISADDSIKTLVFPGRDEPIQEMPPVIEFHRSTNWTKAKVLMVGQELGLFAENTTGSKRDLLNQLEQFRQERGITDSELADEIACALYLPEIKDHLDKLPSRLHGYLSKRLERLAAEGSVYVT